MQRRAVRKAVIPAAGLGSRLLPCTKSQPKEMLAVGRLPTIQHVVEEVVAADIATICMVTGWQKRAIEDHFDLSHGGLHALKGSAEELGVLADRDLNRRLFYIRQAEQRGLGDAVAHGEQFVAGEPFLVALGDTILYSPTEPRLLRRLLEAHAAADVCATILVEPVSPAEVVKYGIVSPIGPVADHGPTLIRDIVEKPAVEDAPSHYAVASRYVFEPVLFEALARTRPGRGGEIQLTDAIRLLLQEGHRCQVVPLQGAERRYDIGGFGSYFRAFCDMALRDPAEGAGLRAYLRGKLAEEA
ncbi:MAG: UTP--glucose-1-phosphate uridylyltransferase [Fimbriimonadaceae bacterium]|nr:UTP--glucose-1-phosphate uridylyltransferase [Fimbriimonadaceae bacterium]